MIITINNKRYDITEFLNEHPGGKDVFINGADMTEQFDMVGHSKNAIKMLEKYLITDPIDKAIPHEEIINNDTNHNMVDINTISIFDFLYKKIILNDKFKKLFTHEDYLNMHKVLGGLTLFNFFYSMFDLYYSGCNGTFTIRKFGLEFFIFLFINLVLSLSSLQFKIPIHGNYTTISINEEYRLHSIIFVIRHVLIILMLHFFKNTIYSHILIPIIVLSNMYFADLISYFKKTPNDKLGAKIGSIPFWSNCSDIQQQIITSIYTFAQIYATFILISLNSNIEVNLIAIFIIQITAFMGTLSKKGIINNFQWHLIYLFQYGLFGWLFYNNTTFVCFKNVACVLLLWILRTKLGMNKFLLWSCVSIICLFTKYINNNILLIATLSIIYLIFNQFNLCFDKKRDVNHNIILKNDHISNTKLHIIDIKMKNNITFKTGQYINLFIDKEKRPYTPINFDVSANSIQFFIKDYGDNKMSEKICALKNNMYIHLDGPFGNNYYDNENDLLYFNNKIIEHKNIIMFYCGTGITPFYSMLKNKHENTRYKFKVVGSLHSRVENYFEDIKQTLYFSDNKLTTKKINKILKGYNPENTTILLCGSERYNNMIIECTNNKFTVCKW